MRKPLIAAAMIAAIPLGAAMAQQTQVTTTVTTQEPATVNPEANNPPVVPPVQAVPSTQAAPGAVPAADGVIHQWGPQEAIAQAVPPPVKDYPPCTRGRTDSCYNPNPRKEADVRKDGKIGA